MTEREALKLALEALEGLIKKTSGQSIYSFMETERRIAMSACVGINEVLAQQCVCGEPNSAGTHRTDGPCLAPQPEQEPVGRIASNVKPVMRQELMLYTDEPLPIGTALYVKKQFKTAPCIRHCEANAFKIEIKNLQAEIKRAVLQERNACLKICEEQANSNYWEGADVCVTEIKKRGSTL